jgi:RNA polymerase sigma factor (sigma-70 family)
MNFTTSNSSSDSDVVLWLAQIRPELLRYCRSLTCNEWDAEDLVQDTLIRLLDRLNAEPGLSLSKPYVFRAARNLWIDYCRKRQRQASVPFDELAAEPAARPGDDAMVTRELLEQLMHRLLPKPFVIVLLCDVFGLTAKQTGACINMAEGTVQVALSRARKRLRQLALRDPDAAAADQTNVQPRGNESFARLLEAVTVAFRRHDPRLIYDAYVRLFESGSHLAVISSQGGRLYFTFRDPDGNLLMVSG